MSEADREAKRLRLERERAAGVAFGERLCEKLAANTPRIEDLAPRSDWEGADDAA